jgi:PAS domain S-box-containing protein
MPAIHHPRHHRVHEVRALQARLAATEQALQSCQHELATLRRIAAPARPDQPYPTALTEERATVDASLHTILDHLAAGVLLLDSDGRFLYANARATAGLGLAPADLIGRSILDILPPAVAQAELEQHRRFIATQDTPEYEITFDTRIGSRTFLMTRQLLSEAQDTGHTILLSAVDLTAYKRAEAALEITLAKYQALFDSLPLGITVSDATGQIVESNAMAEQLLGLGRAEQQQRTIDDTAWQIVRPDGTPLPPEEYASVRALHERRLVENVEMGVVKPNGEITWLNVTAAPLPLADDGVVITYNDISARRQAEVLVATQRDLAHIITTVVSPEEAWPRCLELAQRVTGMDSGGIYLFTADGQALDLACHHGLGVNFIGAVTRYPINTPQVQLILSKRAPYYTFTRDAIQRLSTPPEERMSAMVVIPIHDHDQVLGCINLSSHRLPEVPAMAHQALEIIGAEIGNLVIYLRTATALRALNADLERRVAERTAALQASQERLTLATRSASIGIWDWDIVADTVTWDEQMYELYGIAPATFGSAYEAWFNGLHPVDRAEAERVSLRTRRGEQAYDTEFRVCHPDGTVRVLKAFAVVQRDPGGEALRMIGVNFDITERRRAEAQLRQSEQQYRTLVERMTQGVIVYQEGRVTFCSKAATHIIGCDIADLLDGSVGDLARLLHADDPLGLQSWLESNLIGVSTILTPFHFTRTTDGKPCWITADATATTYGGQPAVLVMLSDVTGLKLAEAQLRLSEIRLHMLLSNTPAVIFTALAEPDYRTTFISDTVHAVLGYAPAHYLKIPTFWASCIHPEDAVALRSAHAVLREVGTLQAEYRVRHADGSYRWIENGLRLLPAVSGHPAEVIGYMIDITARKQSEEMLRQANCDMARAARMKDEFLASMSHELRSPLNAILGLSESLQEGIYAPLSERQQGAVHHIEASGRHLLALINDILDVSKVEAGRMALEVEPLDIAEVCQASLLFVKELALKKPLRLTFVIDDHLNQMEADPRRLKQILVNLLSNAVKFTPPGGQVALEVRPDPVTAMVCFAVRDTGIGIAPADLAQLFQPFVQIDSSLSRQHAGTGLGLALVRRLAELHGGRIMVESTPGQGSCFTLILPRHLLEPGPEPGATAHVTALDTDPLPSAQGTALPRKPGAGPTRILLAEDSEVNIMLLDEYLTSKGGTVSVARTGPLALSAAVAQRPDLILMDIQLPELDGLVVMQQLRTLPEFATTPIIALTALNMPGDRERCLAAGASAHMAKPVVLQELVRQIHQLLRA